MLTFRYGMAGAGAGMAEYYALSDNVPELSASLARYYAAWSEEAAAVPNEAMHPLIAERLGIDPMRAVSTEDLANLLNGKRTDGQEIGKKASRNAYIDLTFSAPKSLSVAIVLAPTEAERALLDKAHTDAVRTMMAVISEKIGSASIGDTSKNRARLREPAHIAYLKVEHYTARPTYKLARGETTELKQLAKGDPQRHTHVLVPFVAVTDSGRVTSIYQDALDQRIHEWGSLYQAFLATNLRKLGVNVELDNAKGLSFNDRMARLTDVPRRINELYSKRSSNGENVARDIAADAGLVFDDLSPEHRAALLGKAINDTRQAKDVGGGDYADWLRQAKEANYRHRSVLRPGSENDPAAMPERQKMAYEVSLPLLNEQFERRAVIEGSIPRIAAAKGFIASGIEDASEVNAVTSAYRTEGVLQDKHVTSVHWAFDTQKKYARVTTQLSVEMEQEAVDLLREAYLDKSVPITPEAIQRAVDKLSSEFDFTSPHGLKQRALAEKTMEGSRAMAWVGGAGVGKSTLLRIPILAWHEMGRETMGITLAWRQTTGLVDAGVGQQRRKIWEPDKDELVAAGIAAEKTFALDPFIRGVESGRIVPTPNTTVIVDEVGLVGTKQELQLARLRAKHGFQLVELGDDMQNQPIEAGATLDLARRAFGAENVPELVDSIRQDSQRDRDIAFMFRTGDARQALALKDQDGTLRIVPGGYSDAIKATVGLWWERRQENAGNPRYTLGISVPTNADGRALGEAIRAKRRDAGEVGPDVVTMDATDQNGAEYPIALAAGDHVRLFHRVRGLSDAGKSSIVGNNGSVVTVVAVTTDGIRVLPKSGRERFVGWEALRKEGSPRIRLAYGDAVTIDARQSDTLSDHITSMPGGSSGVNGFNIYTADSRHRKRGYIITSQGAELMELVQRRSIGDPANADTDPGRMKVAIMANMARNLSRQPKKTLALDFLEKSINLRSGAIDAKLATWFRSERPRPQQQDEEGPKAVVVRGDSRPPPAQRPAAPEPPPPPPRRETRPTKRKDTYQMDPVSEFAEALRAAGLVLKGDPVMDGKKRYVPVQGNKKGKKSGEYVGYSDGIPAGFIRNFKTGYAQSWRAGRSTQRITEEDKLRWAAEKQARESARRAEEDAVAKRAYAIWRNSKQVGAHEYLTRKGVGAHGVLQNARGEIVVPMRDAGGWIRNVQTITADGDKRFLYQGRKKGLFAQLGERDPTKSLLIAEGYATAATLFGLTGLPVVVAFDVSNLAPVASALREAGHTGPMVFAADNDHHLPRQDPPLPNAGIVNAEAAAAKVDGVVISPRFGDVETRSLSEGEKPPTDYNDLAALLGEDKVRAIISAQLKEKGIDMQSRSTKAERAELTQAQRDAARAQQVQNATQVAEQARQQQVQRQSEQRKDTRDLTR